jgi:hypothetical protein
MRAGRASRARRPAVRRRRRLVQLRLAAFEPAAAAWGLSACPGASDSARCCAGGRTSRSLSACPLEPFRFPRRYGALSRSASLSNIDRRTRGRTGADRGSSPTRPGRARAAAATRRGASYERGYWPVSGCCRSFHTAKTHSGPRRSASKRAFGGRWEPP